MMKSMSVPKSASRRSMPNSGSERLRRTKKFQEKANDSELSDELGQNINFIDVPKKDNDHSKSLTINSKSTHSEPWIPNESRQASSGKRITHTTNQCIVPLEILSASQEHDPDNVFDINLHGKQIAKIEKLDKFTKVRIIDLSCNHIAIIENLTRNKEMRELKLYDNEITRIEQLDSLTELSTLQLQHNYIHIIGKGLANLRKLKILRLDNNKIEQLTPRDFASLSRLTYLDLSHNCLDNISAITSLPVLEELYVTHNELRVITDLSRCRRLQEVDFTSNKLVDVSGLKGLSNLKIVNLTHNMLLNMKTLGKLKCLEELNLSHNRLTELSGMISYYPALQIFNIANNNISCWNEISLASGLVELYEFHVGGNPCCTEDGEMPQYHMEIQTVIPHVEVIDGVRVKRKTAQNNAPVMRPMTAAKELSSRQIESQMNMIDNELSTVASSLTLQFDKLRSSMCELPLNEDKVAIAEVRALPSTAERPTSKCGKRSRIYEARMFAEQYTRHDNNS